MQRVVEHMPYGMVLMCGIVGMWVICMIFVIHRVC